MTSNTERRPVGVANNQSDDPTDARDFVESVMSSQRYSRVDTPVQSGRKRHLSVPSTVDSTVKKARVTATARRSLYKAADVIRASPANVSPVNEDTEAGEPASIREMISVLSADMHMMFSALTERVDKLESGLEQRIASKVAQLLDKRVNAELNRIKKDVDNRLETFKDTLKEEMSAEIADINSRLQNVSVAPTPAPAQPDRSLNVVIRDLPATHNENVTAKVNGLIKDGLRLTDVTCTKAERKRPFNESKSGVIIASFSSHDDKRKIMQKKKNLKFNKQFDRVFIQHDLSQPDRIMNNNFRTILSALREQNLTIRGNRVVKTNRESSDTRRPRNGDNGSSEARGDRSRDNSRDQSRGQAGAWQSVGGNGQRHGGQRDGYGGGRQSHYRRH